MNRLKKIFSSEPKIANINNIDFLYDSEDTIRWVYNKIELQIKWRLERNDYIIITENKSLLNRSFTIAKKWQLLWYKEIWIIELHKYITAVRDNLDEWYYSIYLASLNSND